MNFCSPQYWLETRSGSIFNFMPGSGFNFQAQIRTRKKWIWICNTAKYSVEDPDPYSKYRSGSWRVNWIWIRNSGTRTIFIWITKVHTLCDKVRHQQIRHLNQRKSILMWRITYVLQISSSLNIFCHVKSSSCHYSLVNIKVMQFLKIGINWHWI